MGMLVDGEWRDRWYDTEASGGRFERENAQFRHWVTADGSPGPSGRGGFKAEPGRYHLYVSLACPWANRTLIFRHLKGLEEMIGLSVVHWRMKEHGWTFEEGDGVIPDPIHRAEYMHQVYTAALPDYSGRVTVPVLWDKQEGRVRIDFPSKNAIYLLDYDDMSGRVRLAEEDEFSPAFPDCEVGAEPPFGPIYDVPMVVDEGFTGPSVAFDAGTHTDTMTVSLDDYLRVTNPKRGDLTVG
mgnify:CR=1 FL=1